MPYKLQKSGKGFKVATKGTGKTHSKKPLPRARAVAQMRALYANEPDAVDAAVKARAAKFQG